MCSSSVSDDKDKPSNFKHLTGTVRLAALPEDFTEREQSRTIYCLLSNRRDGFNNPHSKI